MIRCKLVYQSKKLNIEEVYLPCIPVKGRDNFDINENDQTYNFHVVDIDFFIVNNQFKHVIIYLNND